ncbi:transposase [marine bacterium AO1-C]|nr:transposase [marine bacterium AO1-C]
MEEVQPEYDHIGFFTATIYQWKKLLAPKKYKQLIIDSLSFLVEKKKVKVYSFVIMPNHIHLLWQILPPYLLKNIQRDFLKYTGQKIYYDLKKNHPQVLEHFAVDASDRRYQFWQKDSLTKFLPSRKVIEQKLDYIHNNPVQKKWMLADSPIEYEYSSCGFYEIDNPNFKFLSHYMEFFE